MTIALESDNTTGVGKFYVGGVLRAILDATGFSMGAGKRIAQRVRTRVTAVASGTTQVPVDTSIPQITEGDQYMSVTVTPTVVGSTFKVYAHAKFGLSASGNYIVGSIFRDAVADALDTSVVFNTTALGAPGTPIDVYTEYLTTSLTPITFRFRAGPGAAVTLYLNGTNGGGPLFTGALASHMLVEEYLP